MSVTFLTLAELRKLWRAWRDFPAAPILQVINTAIHYAAIVEAEKAKARARLLKHRKGKAKLAKKKVN